MATPNQLLNKDAVNIPGIDPITEDSFKGLNPAGAMPGIPQPPMAAPGMPQGAPMGQPMPQGMTPASLQVAQNPYLPSMPSLDTNPTNPIQAPKATAEIYEGYENALREASQEEIDLNKEKAAIQEEGARNQQDQLKLSEQEWQDGLRKSQESMDRIKDSIAKGRAMGIDPDRYWNRKGTFSNILSAISVGLGSFASGMTRGATGNPGMTMLMSAIEHDIDAQKADVDNYWNSVKQEFQLEDTAFNRNLANKNFRSGQMMAGLELTKLQLSSMEARSANPIVKKDLAKMQADLQLRQLEEQKKSGEYIALIEKARREEELKRQQSMYAAQANLAKDADKRNAMVKDLANAQVAQGVPADEAMRNALKETDALFPQLAGSKFASPGQAYQYYQYNAQENTKKQQAAAKKMGKDNAIANIMKSNPGVDKAQAEAQYNMLMNSPDEYTKKILSNIPGASVDPYAKGADSPSSDPRVVADPVDPSKTFRFPSKEAAKEYNDRASAVYQFAQDADELLKLRQKHNGGFSTILNPDDAKREQQIRQRMAGTWAKANGGGNALSDKEFERAMDLIPQASSYSVVSDPSKQLQELKQLIMQKNVVNAEGLGGKAYGSVGQPKSNASSPTNEDVMDGSGWTPSTPGKQKSAPPKVDSSFDMSSWIASGSPKSKPQKAAHSTPDKGNKRK